MLEKITAPRRDWTPEDALTAIEWMWHILGPEAFQRLTITEMLKDIDSTPGAPATVAADIAALLAIPAGKRRTAAADRISELLEAQRTDSHDRKFEQELVHMACERASTVDGATVTYLIRWARHHGGEHHDPKTRAAHHAHRLLKTMWQLNDEATRFLAVFASAQPGSAPWVLDQVIGNPAAGTPAVLTQSWLIPVAADLAYGMARHSSGDPEGLAINEKQASELLASLAAHQLNPAAEAVAYHLAIEGEVAADTIPALAIQLTQ